MNNTKSIELANTWKQEFANKVTKTKTIIETLPDGTHTSKMELLPCDSTLIPVLLLGNKYDLVRNQLVNLCFYVRLSTELTHDCFFSGTFLVCHT